MKITWSRTLFRAFRLRLRLRRRAFRCIFARSLAKDAAPIPNAKGLLKKTLTPLSLSLICMKLQCGQNIDKKYIKEKRQLFIINQLAFNFEVPLGIEPKSKEPESFILSV